MRLAVLGIGIGLLLLLAACSSGGGDAERVLVLPSGDFTEAAFLADLRRNFVGNADGFESLCATFDGLSNREAADVAYRDPERTPTQESVAEDEERAAALIKGECKRVN